MSRWELERHSCGLSRRHRAWPEGMAASAVPCRSGVRFEHAPTARPASWPRTIEFLIKSDLCGSQVGFIMRQMIRYAITGGCRYGLLTDMHHLIVFRFVTEVVQHKVCCVRAPAALANTEP